MNPGRRAAKKVREYAQSIGLDLSDHRSKLIRLEDLEWADFVLYMDGGNFKRLESLANGAIPCAHYGLGEFIDLPRIQDPNYLPRGKELQDCLDTIVLASREFAHRKTPVG